MLSGGSRLASAFADDPINRLIMGFRGKVMSETYFRAQACCGSGVTREEAVVVSAAKADSVPVISE